MKKILLSCLALAALCVADANARTIDDLTGYYTETCSLIGDGKFVVSKDNYSDTVLVSKVDESTLSFSGILGSEDNVLTGIVDLENNTILLAPQTVYSWYTLSDSTSVKDPITIKIAEDGTLSFGGGLLTCYGSTYGTDVKSSMVKYADAEPITRLFQIDAQVYAIDSDSTILYSGKTTLTKYDGGKYPYVLEDYCGNGTSLKFYVDADGCIHTNGQEQDGWTYLYYQDWNVSKNDYIAFEVSYSEIEDKGAESGSAVLYGWYYEDYYKWETTGHSMYYYINWGDQMSIQNVAAEKSSSDIYSIDGRRADKNVKGLMVRDGKAIFVK